MSDAEVRDELFTMLAAGHETTATELAFAFELLMRNPAVRSRLRDELEAGRDDTYLDAVVKEALRIRPVIPGVGRVVRSEPFRLNGYVIPPGVEINPSIRMIHHRADLYPQPSSFRPERFVGADAPDTYTWLPFGGGIRRCIGAALAQAEIAEVLRVAIPAVELAPVRERADPVVLRGITLAPRFGVQAEVGRARARSAGSRVAAPA